MTQLSDFNSCIATKAEEIRAWAQGTYREVIKFAPDSIAANKLEGISVMRFTLGSAKTLRIELKNRARGAFLSMEGREWTEYSGPLWSKLWSDQYDTHFAPSKITLSLPVSPKDKEGGITARSVTVRFGAGDTLTHISMQRYYESPQLVTQDVLEEHDQLGMPGMLFYISHATSISVRNQQEDGAFIWGDIHLRGDTHYSLKEWPSLARLQAIITPTWTLQSGQKPELGLMTASTSDRPLASVSELFRTGLDSSTGAQAKIGELCDACPEFVDLENWLNLVVLLITTTGLSITTIPSAKPRASLSTKAAQALLA